MGSFENDIKIALKRYPSLKQIGARKVTGLFTATQKESGVQIETYEVLIDFPPDYPFVFPEVKEISNKIPKVVARHVFPNTGNLCFANFVDTMMICKNNISFVWFLENILNPHLCREFVKEETGNYITGERSHSSEGNWESYYELLKTTDKKQILNEIEFALNNHRTARNSNCICNSGKKYKRCHLTTVSTILEIGIANARKIYNYLKTDLETRKL